MVETRRAWEAELGCLGHFGFGGGYAAVKEGKDKAGFGLYCNVCPMSQACWTEHRVRAREVFPVLMEELERLIAAAGGNGQKGAAEFWRLHHYAPPEIAMIGGNIEDGMAIAFGEKPKDRGRATLTWPLSPRSRADA